MIDPANCTTLKIMHGNTLLSFYFDTIYFKEVVKYCVTVFEDYSKVCVFVMEEKNEKWRIINAPQIEGRFMQHESLLNTFLKENAGKGEVDSHVS